MQHKTSMDYIVKQILIDHLFYTNLLVVTLGTTTGIVFNNFLTGV